MKQTTLLLWLCLLAIISHAQTLDITPSSRADLLRRAYLDSSKSDYNNNRIWIMAHRGNWNEANPESGMGAYQRAVDNKFEILELDVRFSAPYKMVNGVQTVDANGDQREVILQHDKTDKRAPNGIGLFKFDASISFDNSAKKKNPDNGLKFVQLDKIVPYRADNKNCMVGANGVEPTLLYLDGTASTQTLVHFPKTASRITGNANYNTMLAQFYTIVKDNILLNHDKLKGAADFQDTYDVMKNNGLLGQSIFKARSIRSSVNNTGGWKAGFAYVDSLFGGRNLSTTMFTPIFTKYDFLDVNGNDNGLCTGCTETQKYEMQKAIVDNILLAEQQGKILMPGCEIVYETETDWLMQLANYVNNVKKKRVVQFGVIIENKQGVWAGNANLWDNPIGNLQNYWSWLYNNPATKFVNPSIYVGDKASEFRAYLNSLGYNQDPNQTIVIKP